MLCELDSCCEIVFRFAIFVASMLAIPLMISSTSGATKISVFVSVAFGCDDEDDILFSGERSCVWEFEVGTEWTEFGVAEMTAFGDIDGGNGRPVNGPLETN